MSPRVAQSPPPARHGQQQRCQNVQLTRGQRPGPQRQTAEGVLAGGRVLGRQTRASSLTLLGSASA